MPSTRSHFAQKEPFDSTAGCFSQHETGREHFRIIENEQIAARENRREIAEHPMRNRAVSTPVMQQPGLRAMFSRHLRDQFGWQLEIEIIGAHGLSSAL